MKKTAFIAIVGRPNVGKSTLMNALLGEKVVIVSSKPQTTRNRIMGVLTKDENQFVFLDTHGIHKPKTKLGNYMMKSVRSSMGSADAVILIADAGRTPGMVEHNVVNQIKEARLPAILVLNKLDLYNREQLAKTIEQYAALYAFDAFVPVSALKEKNINVELSYTGSNLMKISYVISISGIVLFIILFFIIISFIFNSVVPSSFSGVICPFSLTFIKLVSIGSYSSCPTSKSFSSLLYTFIVSYRYFSLFLYIDYPVWSISIILSA